MQQAAELLREAATVFWDFDGVIKDSVSVKTDAFERLFAPYGVAIASRVREHHERNGGLSRLVKMPIYLRWAGESAEPKNVQTFCDRFSKLVLQAVIDSPWVPGVREYLETQRGRQRFVLITATPYDEIVQILEALALAHCFDAVNGAPTVKSDAIANDLRETGCAREKALVVGDSDADLQAAQANDVRFLLRRTAQNGFMLDRITGPTFESLTP